MISRNATQVFHLSINGIQRFKISEKQHQTPLVDGGFHILIKSAEITFIKIGFNIIKRFWYFFQLTRLLLRLNLILCLLGKSHHPRSVALLQNDMRKRHHCIYGIIQETQPLERHLHRPSFIYQHIDSLGSFILVLIDHQLVSLRSGFPVDAPYIISLHIISYLLKLHCMP